MWRAKMKQNFFSVQKRNKHREKRWFTSYIVFERKTHIMSFLLSKIVVSFLFQIFFCIIFAKKLNLDHLCSQVLMYLVCLLFFYSISETGFSDSFKRDNICLARASALKQVNVRHWNQRTVYVCYNFSFSLVQIVESYTCKIESEEEKN